jgi:hypothetical protein
MEEGKGMPILRVLDNGQYGAQKYYQAFRKSAHYIHYVTAMLHII